MIPSTDPFYVVFYSQVHHKFRAGIDFRTFPPSMPKTKSQKTADAAPGPAFKGRGTYTSSAKAVPAKSQDAPSRATRSNNVPAPASQALSAPEASQASAFTDSLPPKKRNPLAGPTHIEPSNPIASQVRAYRRADDHLNIVEGVLESIQIWEEGKIRHHDRQSTTKAILDMYYSLSDVVQGGFRASLGEHVRKLKQKWKALAAECDALSLAAKLEESWSKDDENAWVCLAGMRNAVKKENEWKVPRPDLSRLALKEGGKEEGKVGVPVGMVDEEEEEGEEDENAYNKAMELANLLFPARDATQNLGEASTAEEAEELVEGVVARIQAGDSALWAGSECDPFAALDMLKSTGKLMRNVVTYEHDLRDSKRLLVLIPALQGARPQTFTRHMIQAKVGPKPHYTRTLYGILSVTTLPLLLGGIILACIGYLAVGYSLIFIPVSLSQWAWNTCSHVLAFAHHRYTSKGHDDILLPTGVVTEVYQATPSAPTSLPPSARASVPPSFPSSMEGEEETKMEGDYSTLKV
ncbi:hypothetical protein NSK_005449 [Nannochloropsis salina CCMP1776]|uniref:Uncharacterized protein n=1 Tax=Nannochloropsis salina CCMP1776 TaxID=1027361 RepID=A0A4D9CVA1_9STRA|nr:hypothetical protein NSK_005449 [Nannochloropsis salina CCMP1776]|eukprot:TFJ83231.1 hypothetical protein NSK_005449 [Nannochloropsis salina CCMP1776]